MLIKWGSIIVDGSGKLGGHVFSKSRGGNTVRTLARATNPQTTFQQIIRSRFTQLSQGWRDLTEAQRESWYAAESSFSRINRFGDVVLLSGKNLYNSLNANRQILGLSVLNLAPLPSEIPMNTVSRAEFKLSIGRLDIFGDFIQNSQYVVVATKGLSNGVRSADDRTRIVRVSVSGSAGNAINEGDVIYSRYVDKFGVPLSGTKIFVGTYSISVSGQRSPVSSVVAVFV